MLYEKENFSMFARLKYAVIRPAIRVPLTSVLGAGESGIPLKSSPRHQPLQVLRKFCPSLEPSQRLNRKKPPEGPRPPFNEAQRFKA